MAAKPHRISFISLVSAFGWIGLTSFGGGRAAYFRHIFVASKRWMNDEQFLEGLTVSQIVPGPNISNLSIYLGQRMRGLPGALLAVSAVVLPGAVMILVLAVLYYAHGNLPQAPAIFRGVGAAAVGLSVATGIQVGSKGVKARSDVLFAATAFVAAGLFHLSLIIILLTIGAVSVWYYRPRGTKATALQPAQEDTEHPER